MLIVLEGPDGSGKSELGKKLAKALHADLIEFPDDTAVTGPVIRQYLRGEWAMYTRGNAMEVHAEVSALAFQSLQVANRMERMPRLEGAAGSPDTHMVLVRYWQSGWVYGSLDGLDSQWLFDVHASMARADLNILLDLRVEKSLERIGERGEETERYEKREFMERVRELYLNLWMGVPKRVGGIHPDWPIVDASDSREEVFAQVRDLVNVALGVNL